MSFPRYPSYKDSGLEWLGEVPEHWEVSAVRRCLLEHRQGYYSEADYVDTGVKLLRITDLRGFGRVDFTECPQVEDRVELKPFLLKQSDFVFARTGGAGTFGLVETIREPVAYASYLIRFRFAESIDTKFLRHFFLSSGFRHSVTQNIHGGVNKNIHAEDIKNQYLSLPPAAEQAQIAAFLDRETAKIDGLVAEQRRLMELLNEQIISLVLSSFEAPETSALRLSEASTIISRPVIQAADESYKRIGLYNRGRGLFHKDASEMDDMGESDFFWIEEGDLIISGQFAWEGAVALADQEDTGCVVSHRYPVIRGKAGVTLTEYLFGLLCTKHGDFLMNENSRGAAGRNRPLNISSLMKEKIPVPSIEIQKAVAQVVHARKGLFNEIAKAIALLQERRTALISTAVTGQIDVRQLTEEQTA